MLAASEVCFYILDQKHAMKNSYFGSDLIFGSRSEKKMLSGESNVHLYLRNSLAVELLCVLYSSCQSEGFALSFSAWGEILQLRL